MGNTARTARRLLTVSAVAAGLVAVSPMGGTAEAQSNGCPSVGGDFSGEGPFDVTEDSSSGNTFYSPSDLGSQGCDTHPVILWGNGTGASPSTYESLLEHWASHGFIVAAADTANAGSGTQMLDGLDQLEDWNSSSSSRFSGNVDLDNVGASGHSQGGGGAVNAGKDSRVDVIFPLQPWSQNQNGLNARSIFFAGGSDTLVPASTVEDRYEDVEGSMPAAYAELDGASHFEPVGSGGDYRGPSTAWARWHLMGDSDAVGEFVGSGCGLCSSSDWEYQHNDLLEDLGDGNDDDDDDDNDSGSCVTATNAEHEDAGRATRSWLVYRAAGSGDFLGFYSSSTTSLEETSSGTWEAVDGC